MGKVKLNQAMRHIKRLAHPGALLSARLCGAGLTFLVQAAIARSWGSGVLADYLLLISAANILGMAMPLGFQTIGSYFAVEYAAQGKRADLVRFLRRAHLQIGASAAALGTLIWALGTLSSGLSPLPIDLLWPGFAFAIAMASVFVCGAVLVGLKHAAAGLLTDGLFRPLVVLAGFAIAVSASEGSELLLMVRVMGAAYFAVAVICFAYTLRAVAHVTDASPVREDQSKRWWRFAVPWVIITTATEFFFDLNLLVLSALLGKTELAVFGVSARVFALLAFGVTAVYALMLPDMMRAEALKDTKSFRSRLNEANLVASIMALLLLGFALVGGPWVLALFGPAFEQGRWVLAILSALLLVRTVFGPAELVLSLQDRPWAAVPAVAAGLAGLVAANLVLVSSYGLIGAAWAALMATVLSSAVKWTTARLLTGVDVSLLGRFQAPVELTTVLPRNAHGSKAGS